MYFYMSLICISYIPNWYNICVMIGIDLFFNLSNKASYECTGLGNT